MTRLDMYKQAIAQLEKACDEFDQFRSSLKDCGLGGIDTGNAGMHRLSDYEMSAGWRACSATSKL